jgi:hypothetical protein
MVILLLAIITVGLLLISISEAGRAVLGVIFLIAWGLFVLAVLVVVSIAVVLIGMAFLHIKA